MNERVHIVCVLSGDWPGATDEVRARVGDLGAHYVKALKGMVDKFAPADQPYSFKCFTDRVAIDGVECAPIPKGIWSYFNKLYLFSPDAIPYGARVLYLDLDTCIVGRWAALGNVDLAFPVMLRDAWHGQPASGIMAWRQSYGLSAIWRDFQHLVGKKPPFIHPMGGVDIRTDEQWLYPYVLPDRWTAWQDHMPDQLFSAKYHLMGLAANGRQFEAMTPEKARNAKVIYFHGTPRPHTFRAHWNPIHVQL